MSKKKKTRHSEREGEAAHRRLENERFATDRARFAEEQRVVAAQQGADHERLKAALAADREQVAAERAALDTDRRAVDAERQRNDRAEAERQTGLRIEQETRERLAREQADAQQRSARPEAAARERDSSEVRSNGPQPLIVAGDTEQPIEDGGLVRSADEESAAKKTPASTKSGDEVEGGLVAGADTGFATKDTTLKDKVTATLAYVLLGVLGLTILLQYLVTGVLVALVSLNHMDPTQFATVFKPIEQIFNTLLPVLSGLVGSAVTYYFAREARAS